MSTPQGLKVYPNFATPKQVQEILEQNEFHNQTEANHRLFRYYGDFGTATELEPASWMLAWGKKLKGMGFFNELPNQYRVCDWKGELSSQFKWHIDNRRHGEQIFVISLSSGRKIGFRDKKTQRTHEEIALDSGDAYMMQGASRWQWEHRVVPTGKTRSGGRSFVVSFRRSGSKKA